MDRTMTPSDGLNDAALGATALALNATEATGEKAPVLDTNVDKAKLLAILEELRNSVGTKAVDDAVVKVLSDPSASSLLPGQRSNKRQKKGKKKEKVKREFQMDNYAQRKVAIKFFYIGEKYDGFARQGHTDETVERYMFNALVQTKMIKDIDSSEYTRCGRTDKGVSAFGQVISLKVRSNLPVNGKLLDHESIDEVPPGVKFRVQMPKGDIRNVTEVDYTVAINRALPDDIRVYSVVAAPSSTFSARFDCDARMYRYFFVRKSLDIEKMRLGAAKLIGEHDYRNFCRIDTSKHTFTRAIRSFEILKCEENVTPSESEQIYRFEIFGKAFLWHQVRCMVQVLFLIGEGKEEPEIVDALLDIEANPRKPQYEMASDAPLCLQDCLFDGVNFDHTPLAMYHVYDHLSSLWERSAIKTAMLRSNLDMMAPFTVNPKRVIEELDHYAPKLEELMKERGYMEAESVLWTDVRPLLPLSARTKYFPLLTRNTGDSVQEKKDKMSERKRRRQGPDDEDDEPDAQRHEA
ncbi:hypothetical protein Poli38472_006500 [Pythium oligandrum]|uniref:Pseudouridine synthase I TruA alpha/beta domain-containing protein n=1 Tax=Pythium oligandrum TaxID=41045 RepID=A0A8K1FAR4_PYTOL|nr:hypothetical protein Poli38472_006500 [Pythium oligandrum]|eukprot:TMW56490.1 hypothetical protein Poli38472_006500 [Pythium oligandrum]